MKTIGNLYSLFAASDNRLLDVMHRVKHSSYPPSKWRLQHDIMILLMRLGRGEKHALSIYMCTCIILGGPMLPFASLLWIS